MNNTGGLIALLVLGGIIVYLWTRPATGINPLNLSGLGVGYGYR